MPETTLSAEVTAVRWRVDDGDFAVLAALTDDGDEVTLVGPLAHVGAGEAVEVDGSFREHPRHGRQFAVQQVRSRGIVSEQALVNLLIDVKHVGIKGANWLLREHGPEVLDRLDEDAAGVLREVPGIGKAKLRAAVESWDGLRAQREVRLFLEEAGVPAPAASRILRAFGAGAVELLREDPYGVARLDGVGFATADQLARALGVPADDPARLDAGLLHALREAEADGHCFLPRTELARRGGALLGVSAALLDARVEEGCARGELVADGDRVLDARMDAVERRLARKVRELLDGEPTLRLEVPEEPPEDLDPQPTATQWAGVQAAVEHRVSILTGLPGTGKTATMRALVDQVRGSGRRVRLCAPTGKAARRLAQLTGADATTIHRLLEYVPGEGFARDSGDPITGADLLIVDEASMLDVRLAMSLFDAVGDKTHVLLVGDVDQLAPVGPGRVLEDLLDSGEVPATRLTEVFRQAARSLIIRAAHAINHGEPPPTKAGEDDVRDFFVVEREGAGAIFDEVVSLAATRLPGHYDLDPSGGVQVLAPMHKGQAGIDAFNEALRAKLNPDGAAVPGTSFRVGDRVLQQRNDHEHQLMNGESAAVVAHDPDHATVTLRCDDGRVVRLPADALSTWRLGWCTSVHKSQGSQFPAVVVVVHRGHHLMLTRSLLYTAVTRAERACVLVGERAAVEQALRTLDARRRCTRLAELVAA
ncbi:AAA family ATPase [Conexibacter sp. SYSU D00693]|uniref:SF1B family DNA helicase RecD2 n=1 Tax=Conexibacter sp. SYSU D00693 TaxID=2812560 RepID=UPI00196A80E8|nr:AAA family ATPase [Conexibacter sp. SYSU D00693]